GAADRSGRARGANALRPSRAARAAHPGADARAVSRRRGSRAGDICRVLPSAPRPPRPGRDTRVPREQSSKSGVAPTRNGRPRTMAVMAEPTFRDFAGAIMASDTVRAAELLAVLLGLDAAAATAATAHFRDSMAADSAFVSK